MPHSTHSPSDDSSSGAVELDANYPRTMAASSYPQRFVDSAVWQVTKDDRNGLPSSIANAEERMSSSTGGGAIDNVSDANSAVADEKSYGAPASGGRQARRSSGSSVNGYKTLVSDQSQRQNNVHVVSPRERIHRESPVIAELRTNVIIKDEFTLVTDLSYHLAQRYNRSDQFIMINVDHSACIALAGSFEPCYILNITAVPSALQPALNKRNAALIQSFMADILSVPPDRGIIRFNAIPDENLAQNGATMAFEPERSDKRTSDVYETSTKRGHGGANSGRRSQQVNKRDTESGRPNALAIAENRRSIPSGVFELDTDVHNANSQQLLNGLRMNGISKEDLLAMDSKLPNGRPKSTSPQPEPQALGSEGREKAVASPDVTASAAPDVSTSIPAPAIRSSNIPISTRASNNPISPRPSNIPFSPKPVKSSPDNNSPQKKPARPISMHSTRSSHGASREKRSVDAGSIFAIAATTNSGSAFSMSTPPRRTTDKSSKDSLSLAAITSNTSAKRRSVITATPKLPLPPPPPEPVAVKDDAKSQKSSRRKSFLAAFRR